MCIRTGLGVVLLLAPLAVAQSPVALDYPTLLRRLHEVDWLWQPPVAGERCVQYSSYDRLSDKGPGDFGAWYANDDRGKYLRVETKDGAKEHVMVDVDGPGAVARLWSANPAGMLHFDVDGERVWTVDFAALCSGKVDGVPEPLAGMRSKGGNCHLPIPFGKHLKVTASKGDLYYQANVVLFAKGTEVVSFRPALLHDHREAVDATCLGLLAGSPFAVSGNEEPKENWRVEVPKASLVRCVRVQLGRRRSDQDLGEAMRRVLLVVRCGTEETVRVPVGDFFAAGAGFAMHRGAMLGVEYGAAYCQFPMPMPQGGSVELVPEDGIDIQGQTLQLRLTVDHVPAQFAGEPLLFRASYHQQKGFDSRPFRDYLMLDAKGGPGRFVGCSLLVKNPTRAWWGEGDEKFYVDGEPFPSTFGTGTEDYFGYAWCSPEPFSSAFHAQPQCDGPGNYGFTSLHRSQVLDSVPFQQSFRFDLEVWHWVEKLSLDYASVAYWYGAPGATSGLPPVPRADQRKLDRLPPMPVFVAPDALEGEDLRVVSASGGEHEIQDLGFRENTFSKDAQIWWKHGKVGDALVLAVPSRGKGTYRVVAAFCKADDYGIVQLSLAGQKLGEPFDAYAERVGTSGPVELGVVELDSHEAELRIEITGKHEKAKPAHMFGLDYLRLEKVR